jgi:FMN phosphatase YigB (HAD superfamily)
MSTILLDIGNVIVTVDFLSFCRGVVPEGSSEVESVYRKYCQGELKERFDCGMIAPFDYLGMIAADPMTAVMLPEDIRLKWQNIFSPLKGALGGVEILEREHRIWIMSDTDPLHFTFLLNRFPLLKARERYFLSYESGLLKNSPEAFVHVLAESGVQADELLLIDDKPENCSAAAEAGISSIRFTSWSETLAAIM